MHQDRTSYPNLFMVFHSHELLRGLCAATTIQCEREHFLALGGLDLLSEILYPSNGQRDDNDVVQCLNILCNLNLSLELRPSLFIDMFAKKEKMRVKTAARDCL